MCSYGLCYGKSKHFHAMFKKNMKCHFGGHCISRSTPAPFMCITCQVGFCHWCDRNGDCFAFFPKRDERMAERGGQADQGTRGGAVLESVLLMLHLHALSLIHCLPPSLILSLSVSFPSSHIPLSSSTYFLGGGGCRYTAWGSAWETQSKSGTDSPRCTDHSGGLHPFSSRLCCSLMLHLKFALCLGWGPLCPHISSVSMLLLSNCTGTDSDSH